MTSPLSPQPWSSPSPRPRHTSHVLDSFTRMHWHAIFSAPERRERLLMAEATQAFDAGQAAAEAGGDGVLAAAICTPGQALRAPCAMRYTALPCDRGHVKSTQPPCIGQVLQAPWDLPPVRRRRRSEGGPWLPLSSLSPPTTLAHPPMRLSAATQAQPPKASSTPLARRRYFPPPLSSLPLRCAPAPRSPACLSEARRHEAA